MGARLRIDVKRVEDARRKFFASSIQMATHKAKEDDLTPIAVESLCRLLASAEPRVREFVRRKARPANAPVFEDSFYALSELGRGGFGDVYLGFEIFAERFVAIKVVRTDNSTNAAHAEQFLKREVQELINIRHPNVVTIHATGFTPAPHMVMEYLDRGTLQDRLVVSQTVMEVNSARAVMLGIAEGVRALHEAELVHADLKPANILFNTHNDAIVSDLGVARRTNTNFGLVVHSYPYTAPELFDPSHPAGKAADIFSLGVMLYELLAGHPPFPSGVPVEQMVRELEKGISLADPLYNAIPDKLSFLLANCVAADASNRPSISEFIEELGTDPSISSIALSDTTIIGPDWTQTNLNPAAAEEVRLEVTPVRIATEILAPAILHKPYKTKLDSAGGRPPFTWTVTGLPPGLTFSPSESGESGWIEGTVVSCDNFAACRIIVALTDGKKREAAPYWPLTLTLIDPDEFTRLPSGSANIGCPVGTEVDSEIQHQAQHEGKISAATVHHEFPLYERVFPAMLMRRHPVTIGNYREFVLATNYPPPPSWTKHPSKLSRRELKLPVIDVSHVDAEAYCRWRGTQLPTEELWERAASQPEHTLYPWGNHFDPTFCNVYGSGLGKPNPIDHFVTTASVHGTTDQCGNVAEWVDGGELREVSGHNNMRMRCRFTKGGSFRTNPFRAMIFNRGRMIFQDAFVGDVEDDVRQPGGARESDVGFRDVVLAQTPPRLEQALILIPGKQRLGHFRMARYVVSNLEYSTFVDATGHRAPSYWGDSTPYFPDCSRHLPVTNIAQSDAEQFCDWRTNLTGIVHRLPTALHWHRAVNGLDGQRQYPWGQKFERWRCNTKAGNLARLTEVDAFSEGCSPEGVFNLCGNVFEWLAADGETRGGSWMCLEPERVCRADSVMRNPRPDGDCDTGFRYVTGIGREERE